MIKFNNFSVGDKIGQLTVRKIEIGKRNRSDSRDYIVQCTCGEMKVLTGSHLKKVKSCGCLQKERTITRVQKLCTFNEQTRNLKAWAEFLGVTPSALSKRIARAKPRILELSDLLVKRK